MQTLINVWNAAKVFFIDVFQTFLETTKTFGWKDAVDILLLTLILYFIYRFIRDRRAGKLLVGLGVVLLISMISEAFDLKALHFLLGDFRQIGLIAVLILFQPELRSVLEKVGGTPLSGLHNITSDARDAATTNAEIDAICTAVADLSREKVGALLVLERTTKLGEYIKSGVYVDAAISPHIVRNLFFNKAPLHDGAVIIRDGRICAAGCFLPLSTQEDINKDLGTRHRAAIGMSEISDAIVIVVSEETGNISLSLNGSLERNFNYSSLKQRLTGLLMTAPNESQGDRGLRGRQKKK